MLEVLCARAFGRLGAKPLEGVNLPAQKPQPPHTAQAKPEQQQEDEESFFSFVPAGIFRSIVEYIAALLPGAILLFAFFVAAEALVLFLPGGDLISASFLPVICIMPVLAGVVSTLALEKIRSKALSMQRGAMVGAAAGLIGGVISVLMMAVIAIFFKKLPFGEGISGILFYVILLVVVFLEAVLAALGGALVVQFIKEP
jgi:hypothetical protein